MLKPMLLTSGPLRPDSDKYSYEVKWDGFRALIAAAPSGIKIWSRNGHDMRGRYPELQGLSGAVTEALLLDGEIVCLDDDGKPDFAALWFCNRGSATPPVCYMIFDVLEVGAESVIDLPYSERRKRLEELELSGSHWCTTDSHIGEGEALFAATKEMGLEGIVAKRVESKYRPGVRSTSWTKTKHFRSCRHSSGGSQPSSAKLRVPPATAIPASERSPTTTQPRSSNPATAATSWNGSRRLLAVNFGRCSSQVACGKAITRSSAR